MQRSAFVPGQLELRATLPLNILFVCSRNQWRSPTAERVFSRDPDLSVRSAGTASSARRRLTSRDLGWADHIVVMEQTHARQIRTRFGREFRAEVHVLGIPDDYQFMDPELVDLLHEVAGPLLERLKAE